MALNIKDEATDRAVRTLAAATGETITVAVRTAVEERLARVKGRRRPRTQAERDALYAIIERGRKLPRLDNRTPDEIIGYDEHGLPT